MSFQDKKKYQSLKPPQIKRPEVEKIRAKLNHFDPHAVVDEYLDQDPRHAKNLNPKQIYEIDETIESQATRVIKKFGGISDLMHALAAVGYPLKRQAIYKWTWEPERGGTGGIIPTRALPYLMAASRLYGIFLSPEDMDARSQLVRKFRQIATTIDGKLIPFIDAEERKRLKDHEEKKRLRAEKKKAKTRERRERLKAKKLEARKLNKKIPIDKQQPVLNGLEDKIDIRHLKRGN